MLAYEDLRIRHEAQLLGGAYSAGRAHGTTGHRLSLIAT